MIYYLDQLAALCRKDPVGTKVVFVPSLQVGYHISTALATSGQSWANLHLTTPLDWARQSVLARLQAEGWKSLLPNYDLFFIGNLVENVLKDEQDGYFSRMTARAELARALLKTILELRQAGVGVEVLEKAGRKNAKLHELAICYKAYVEYLDEQRYYDEARIFERALAELAGKTLPAPVLYAVFDETLLSGLAKHYVERLAGDQLLRIGRPSYSRPVPEQCAAGRFADASILATDEPLVVGLAGRILVDLDEEVDRDQLQMVQVLGAEEEVRFIFRDILANEYRLDEVEIAYTTDGPYLTLLHDLAARFEVPITYASGLPPELTRPGQSLLGFVRWIVSGFDADEFIGLCQARLISFAQVKRKGARVPWPYEMAALLRQGRVRRGRNGYLQGLTRLERELMGQLKDDEAHGRPTGSVQIQLDMVEAARAIMQELLGILPSGKSIELKDLTTACHAFLTGYAPIVEGSYDQDAILGLTVHLRNIGEHVEMSGAPAQLAEHLLELLTQHRVEAASARPGFMFAVPLERAGYTHRQHLYVLGLDEGSFPGRGIEDPVLLDDERVALKCALPLHRTRPGERVWQAERVLGMAPGRTTLLARRRSLEDGAEYYPSAFFQQLEQRVYGEEGSGRPRSFIPAQPAEALDRQEAVLVARRSAGFREAVAQMAPWLVAGAEAGQARAGLDLTRFDGFLGRATPELNPGNGEVLLSASRLETLVQCPYRYFLKYILAIQPVEEYVEDTTRWLNPLTYGRLLHDLLCDFMEELKARDELPTSAHIPAMKARAKEKIEEQKKSVPVTHEAAYRADVERLEQAVEIFLNVEAQQQDVQPTGFEVSFGFGKDGGLHSPKPVSLDLGKGIDLLLRGWIDRVDKVGEGYVIWDYKSGSAGPYKEGTLVHAGAYLQWALYAYALNEILKRQGIEEQVVQSGYFFVSERTYGKRVAPILPPRLALGDLLRPLFELVAQGQFFHLQKEDHCKYCDYHSVCASERVDAKKWKEIEKVMPDGDEQDRVGGWLHG
ncbi:MAG: PD-(D/E)XK nuclease family protein [Candidatus Latescibacteria bacterium]|nr:PD-(D/E)XK nuclease family protein [Candidatus Latescibacterota bacterium]